MRRLVIFLTLLALCRPIRPVAAADEAVIASFDVVEPAPPNPDLPMDQAIPDQAPRADGLNRALCNQCPDWDLITFVGYDAFRSIVDDSWENNGIHVGANLGTRLGPFSDATGVGFQIGGSFGVYDWSGSDSRPTDRSAPQQQSFITYGLFRKPQQGSPWSAAISQDWMLNDNYGIFSTSPTVSQLRGEVSYAYDNCNELGVWGTAAVVSDHRDVSGVGATTWRPIDQINVYWHHKWEWKGADTSIWLGLPVEDHIGGEGNIGEWFAGAAANVPLNDRVALYTLVTYMRPTADNGAAAAETDSWNFTVGVSFSFTGSARSDTVAGRSWTPLLPVANNGYFLVNTNQH
jgi:hypothetical protein